MERLVDHRPALRHDSDPVGSSLHRLIVRKLVDRALLAGALPVEVLVQAPLLALAAQFADSGARVLLALGWRRHRNEILRIFVLLRGRSLKLHL